MTGLGFTQRHIKRSTRARPQGSAHTPAHAVLSCAQNGKAPEPMNGAKENETGLEPGGGAAATAPHKPYQAIAASNKKHKRDRQRASCTPHGLRLSTTRLQVRPPVRQNPPNSCKPTTCLPCNTLGRSCSNLGPVQQVPATDAWHPFRPSLLPNPHILSSPATSPCERPSFLLPSSQSARRVTVRRTDHLAAVHLHRSSISLLHHSMM